MHIETKSFRGLECQTYELAIEVIYKMDVTTYITNGGHVVQECKDHNALKNIRRPIGWTDKVQQLLRAMNHQECTDVTM
jgi:hypothetical protein